jgi:hypothetical protein
VCSVRSIVLNQLETLNARKDGTPSPACRRKSCYDVAVIICGGLW